MFDHFEMNVRTSSKSQHCVRTALGPGCSNKARSFWRSCSGTFGNFAAACRRGLRRLSGQGMVHQVLGKFWRVRLIPPSILHSFLILLNQLNNFPSSYDSSSKSGWAPACPKTRCRTSFFQPGLYIYQAWQIRELVHLHTLPIQSIVRSK